MRLLVLSIEFPPGPGGIGTLAHQVSSHLSMLGWEVTVMSPQNFASAEEITVFNSSQSYRIETVAYVGPFIIEAADRLARAFRILWREKCDLILAVSEQTVWLGALLSLLTRKPLVAVGHGTEFVRGSALRRKLTGASFNVAKRLIADSRYTSRLMARIGIDESRIKVIPPGGDGQLFQSELSVAAIRERFGLEGFRVIVTVGMLSTRKAQDVVIRAMPQILHCCPNTKYLVVGVPIKRPELEALARELQVEENVVFAGSVPTTDLPFIYNLADAFVLVSRSTSQGDIEGYGIVVIEAALCGTPAVVSRSGGLSETIVPNQTGLLVEPEDPEQTAEAICRLLSEDDLREKLGQTARAWALEGATWESRVQDYNRVLEAVLREYA